MLISQFTGGSSFSEHQLAVKPDRLRRFHSPSNFRNIITEIGFHTHFVHKASKAGGAGGDGGRNDEVHTHKPAAATSQRQNR